MPVALETRQTKPLSQGVMYANVFRRPGRFGLEEKPIPLAGPGEADRAEWVANAAGRVRGRRRGRRVADVRHAAVGLGAAGHRARGGRLRAAGPRARFT